MYEFPYVLTINVGSSSLKAEFFAIPTRALLSTCIVEDIGQATARSTITISGTTKTESLTRMESHEAVNLILAFISKHFAQQPALLSHRIVHGGKRYTLPTRVTAEVIQVLHTLKPLAPNHLPIQLACLELLMRAYGRSTHIACFDTAFHAQMPHIAQLTTLPRVYTDAGLRRYGFHGLSYEYVVQTLRRRNMLPEKLVCAHLGNGASICAIQNGVSIETSMGMTPASGLMMSTRSGDIDPGTIHFMDSVAPLTPITFDTVINKESGLKGVSGTTGDMRTLLENQAHDQHAKDAVDLFCYTVKKYIGSYAALLNGVDMIVFTGGIGERSAYIRNEICKDMEYLGLRMEENVPEHYALLSAPSSRVRVEVMHADESAMMYDHAIQFLAL